MNTIFIEKNKILSNGIDEIRGIIQSVSNGSIIEIENWDYSFDFSDTIEVSYPISNTFQLTKRNVFFNIENKSDITIDFKGSNLNFSGWSMPFAINNCNNISLKNFSIDYIYPSNAEARVAVVNRDSFEIEIDPIKYPYFIKNGDLYFSNGFSDTKCWELFEFERDSLSVRGETADKYWNMKFFEGKEKGKLIVKGDFGVTPKVDNLFVLRHGDRTHCGIFSQKSSNLSLSNISIFNSCGIAIVCQFCDCITIDDLSVVPNTKKGRKLLSSHDDGIQISNCRGFVRINGCRFRGLMDDAINIHGTSAMIEKTEGNKLFGKFVEGCSIGFDTYAKAGDLIGFLDRKTLNTVHKNIVNSFKLIDEKNFEIIFQNPIEENYDNCFAIENLSNNPEVICENCLFDMGRARGILIGTNKKALIINNVFNTSGTAILASGDANGWFESGSCRDINIRNNYFSEQCLSGDYQFGEAVITFCPVVEDKENCYGFHSGITINNNTFVTDNNTVCYFACSKDILIENNTIIQSTNSFETYNEWFVYVSCNSVEERINNFFGIGEND